MFETEDLQVIMLVLVTYIKIEKKFTIYVPKTSKANTAEILLKHYSQAVPV